MITNRKYTNNDYDKCIEFLRNEYNENKDENSWLAQRFEDMDYRVNVLETEERGKADWKDRIHIWEEDGRIVAICIGECGNEAWMHIHNGYEFLFDEMLDFAEKSVHDNSGLVVYATKSQKYKEEALLRRGYIKNLNSEEITSMKRAKCDKKYEIVLPEGFTLIIGTKGLNHKQILNACGYGFHPDMEGTKQDYGELDPSWASREKAPMFNYDYEVVTKAPNGEIASYSYVWVDKATNTGYIEPVSTRLKYRKLGLGKAMQQGILNLLADEKVEYCYVNPYGESRDKFYTSCGYETFDEEYEYKK